MLHGGLWLAFILPTWSRKAQARYLSQILARIIDILAAPGRSFRIKLLCRYIPLTHAHNIPTIKHPLEMSSQPKISKHVIKIFHENELTDTSHKIIITLRTYGVNCFSPCPQIHMSKS